MRVKIRGGTVVHGERSLCESCRWSHIIRGVKEQDQIVECSQLSFENQRVPFPVISCTHYLHGNRPTLKEMEETAWLLRSDTLRRKAGFVHSSQLTDDERYVLEED